MDHERLVIAQNYETSECLGLLQET